MMFACPTRQFYVPEYNLRHHPHKAAIPFIGIRWYKLDTNGKATLEFFHPDVKGAYKNAVDGIDNEGPLGRAVYAYEVN